MIITENMNQKITKDFFYWKGQHDKDSLYEFSFDSLGLLWLKTKSIIRKELIDEFCTRNNIVLKSRNQQPRFIELYEMFSTRPDYYNSILDKFADEKNKQQLKNLDERKLIPELYKVERYSWGGDHNNAFDKYLVKKYVKNETSYTNLKCLVEKQIQSEVWDYISNSWYNLWSGKLIEHIFKSHGAVQPAVGEIRNVDFFIGSVPFDLKVTYLPNEFVNGERKRKKLKTEISFLKSSAKDLGIVFDKASTDSVIKYQILERIKDRNDRNGKQVLDRLHREKVEILKDVLQNPKRLAEWLYTNQGEMRFGSENRLFLVLVDTTDFDSSWKLKRNVDLLKPAINKYLSQFYKKKLDGLKVEFRYKQKAQTFTAISDIIFVVKE